MTKRIRGFEVEGEGNVFSIDPKAWNKNITSMAGSDMKQEDLSALYQKSLTAYKASKEKRKEESAMTALKAAETLILELLQSGTFQPSSMNGGSPVRTLALIRQAIIDAKQGEW